MPFILFFSLFFSIYFGLNFYFYYFIKKGLNLSGAKANFLKIAISILAISFPISRFIEKTTPKTLSYVITLIGAIWFGVLCIGVTIFFITDIVTILTNFFVKEKTKIKKSLTSISIIIVTLSSLYALYNGARIPKITKLELSARNLKVGQFSILHLSDLHLNTLLGETFLKEVIEISKPLKPDIIFVTGDLVDADITTMQKFVPLIKELCSIAPVFATTGNHEFYAGINKVEEFYRKCCVNLLRNEKITYNDIIDIVSYDDEEYERFFTKKRPSLNTLFNQCDGKRPIIFLTHRPHNFHKAADSGILLQLSGHTHNGQIFPFNIIVSFIFKYSKGLNSYKDSFIYTSQGTGMWGPPMRLGTHKEIVFITLKKQT